MRIDNRPNPGRGPLGRKPGAGASGGSGVGAAGGANAAPAAGGFLDQVRRVAESAPTEDRESRQRAIGEMMKSLDVTGRDLETRGDMESFRRYRAAVQSILDWASSAAFGSTQSAGRPRMVRGQMQDAQPRQVLQVIDEELSSLLGLVVRQESDRLKIAERVRKMRGLLLDALS